MSKGRQAQVRLALLVAATVLALSAAASPGYGASESRPEITSTKVRGDDGPNDFRVEATAKRENKMFVRIRAISETTGEPSGPSTKTRLNRLGDFRHRWAGDMAVEATKQCYRVAFIAQSPAGKHQRAYRMCIFQPSDRVLMAPW